MEKARLLLCVVLTPANPPDSLGLQSRDRPLRCALPPPLFCCVSPRSSTVSRCSAFVLPCNPLSLLGIFLPREPQCSANDPPPPTACIYTNTTCACVGSVLLPQWPVSRSQPAAQAHDDVHIIGNVRMRYPPSKALCDSKLLMATRDTWHSTAGARRMMTKYLTQLDDRH